jgi:hypothetical protein
MALERVLRDLKMARTSTISVSWNEITWDPNWQLIHMMMSATDDPLLFARLFLRMSVHLARGVNVENY